MILYHFTAELHLPRILSDGFLKVTESNIGSSRSDWPPFGDHVGPDVVWLTDDERPTPRAAGLDGSAVNKMAVRLTVDVPDGEACWWPDFRAHYGMNSKWRRALERGKDPESWWVVLRPIHLAEVVSIDLVTEFL